MATECTPGSHAARPASSSGWLTAGAVLAAVCCLAGCASDFDKFFAGPDTCALCFINSRGGDAPLRLEDDLPAQDPGQVQTLRNVPDSPWRPLGDVKSSATNAADALQELKGLAARAGGNALVRLAEGAGSTRTTTSSSTSSSSDSVNIPLGRGLSVAGGGSTSSASTDSVSVTEFAGLGTALRLAKPGSEPYVGISCLDYIGGWDAWRRSYGRNSIRDYALHRPYVTTVEGPAAKAGILPGQLIVGWKRQGELGAHTATSCKALAAAVSGVGVDGSLQLIVLDPAGMLTRNSDGASNFDPSNPSARSVTVRMEAIPYSWYRTGNAPFERAVVVAPATPAAPTPTSLESPPESWYRSHEAPQPPSPTPPAATEAPARPTVPATTDIAGRLKKLEELKTQKLITDAEYKKQRERILTEGL